jgi:hypothetical protein
MRHRHVQVPTRKEEELMPRDLRDHERRPWKTYDDRAEEIERYPWKMAIVYGVGIILVGAVLAGVIGLIATGSVFFSSEQAKLTNKARVQRKVYDPNNTTTQIAFFHNTCQTVNAQLRAVENNEDRLVADRKAAQYAKDPIRQQQAADALTADQADVTGTTNAVQATAADYNSRSAQSTANVFKDNSLPNRIDLPNPIPRGYKVNCG